MAGLLPVRDANQQSNNNSLSDALDRLRESGAYPLAPSNPLTGEFWYDTTTPAMKYWDGNSWETLGAGDITSVVAGTGLDGGGTSGAVTLDIDATVATLTGSQTLTNKTLTTPTIASFANATHTHQNAAGGGTLDAAAIAAGTVATARLGSGTADNTKFLRGDQTWATPSSGSGDVTGPSSSVDSEVALFSSTTGKVIKRASATGIAKLASGVLSAVTAPSGDIVGNTDTQTLTNKSIDASQLTGTVNNARLDTELQALAGTTSAANKFPYYTGSGTATTDDYIPWTSYTPTWGGTGSNPAIGNGTLQGAYCRMGRTVFFRVKIVAGSTTTFGTGLYTISLPITPSGEVTTNYGISCSGYMEDNGTTGISVINGRLVDTSGKMYLYVVGTADAAYTIWTPTAPFTFGNTDYVSFHGFYDIGA